MKRSKDSTVEAKSDKLTKALHESWWDCWGYVCRMWKGKRRSKGSKNNELTESLIWAVNPGESSRPLIYFLISFSSYTVYQTATARIARNLSYLPCWQRRNE